MTVLSRPLPARLLAAAALCGVSGVPAFAGPPGQDFQLGFGLYQKGRYDAAADAFAAFLWEHPADTRADRAALFYGFSLRDGGQNRAGRDALRDALARDGVASGPDRDLLDDALLRLGLAEEALGDPAAAEAALERLIDDFPDGTLVAPALEVLGRVRAKRGDAAGAEEAFRKFLASGPEPATAGRATLALAKLLSKSDRTDEAVALLRPLAAAGGAVGDQALLEMGSLEYGAGDFAAAERSYSELIGRGPAAGIAADARTNRGYALFQLREFERAVADLTAAAELDPRRAAGVNYWAGRAAVQAGTPGVARERFDAALAADPDGPRAPAVLYELALLGDASADPAERAAAAELFGRISEEFPGASAAPAATRRAAAAARRNGELAEARRLLDRFDERYSETNQAPRAALVRARLLAAEAAAEPASADRLYREAERRFALLADDANAPADVRRDALLARANLQTQRVPPDLSGALAAFRSVADSLEPGEDDTALADALRFSASTAARLGDFPAAAEAAQRFLDLFPTAPQAEAVRATLTEAIAAGGDLDAAVAAYDAANSQGRTRTTNKLAVKLAGRAVAAIEELPADGADRPAKVDDLAEIAARLAGPIADDPAVEGDVRAAALSELGWAAFYRGRFDDAAEAFGRVVREFPQSELRPEALVQYGIALDEAGQIGEAETALKAAWETLAPAEPVAAEAGARGDDAGAWLSGLRLARLLARDGRPEEAAAAFAELHRLFPEVQTGSLLWEWGGVLHRAQRYDEADAVFAQLVDEAPPHPQADTALLLLAESDLFARRSEEAVAKLARLVAPAEDEPVVTDDAVAARAGEKYVSTLTSLGRAGDAAAAGSALLDRLGDAAQAPLLRLLTAEALGRAGDRVAAREELGEVRAAVGPDTTDPVTGARPDWLARPWIAGAELALAAKDYAAVDRLAEELEAWQPPPADLYAMRAVLARSLKQRPIPDLGRAGELATQALEDPAAPGTQSADDMYVLLADLALLDSPKRLEDARGAYLKLNILGSTDAARARGGFEAGGVEEALGNRERAVSEYRDVATNYPDEPAAAEAADRLRALGAAD